MTMAPQHCIDQRILEIGYEKLMFLVFTIKSSATN